MCGQVTPADPRTRPAQGAERHNPALPELFGIYDAAVMALRMEIADMPRAPGPMDAQMASLLGVRRTVRDLGQLVSVELTCSR